MTEAKAAQVTENLILMSSDSVARQSRGSLRQLSASGGPFSVLEKQVHQNQHLHF
jgi:hypothetical protein